MLGIAPFLGPKISMPITLGPGVGRILNLARSAAWMISLEWHRPNFQFPPENNFGGMGNFGTDSSVGPKWRNLNRFRFKFGVCPLFLGIST